MEEVYIHPQSPTEGRLFITGLPEINRIMDPKNPFLKQIDITTIIGLISEDELVWYHPHIVDMLRHPRTKQQLIFFPIPEEGKPPSLHRYCSLVSQTAATIRLGMNVIVFCKNGRRRSRKFAEQILIQLNYPKNDAHEKVWRDRDLPYRHTKEGESTVSGIIPGEI